MHIEYCIRLSSRQSSHHKTHRKAKHQITLLLRQKNVIHIRYCLNVEYENIIFEFFFFMEKRNYIFKNCETKSLFGNKFENKQIFIESSLSVNAIRQKFPFRSGSDQSIFGICFIVFNKHSANNKHIIFCWSNKNENLLPIVLRNCQVLISK